MNNIMTDSIFFGAVISVVGYLIGIFLRKKISVLNPLLVSIIFVIAVIKIFHIDYETYNSGAKYISYLLTPATVCLAIPLYRQISVLKEHAKEVFIGILAGVLASMGSILLMSYLFGLIKEPVAKGLAIGTASHAIGTTKALEIGEIEGAMSSLSVAVAGLMTVISASIFANMM